VIGVVALALSAFQVHWQRNALADLLFQPGGWFGAVAIIAISAPLHEALHVVGWVALGKTAPSSARWIFTSRGLGIAARLSTPISMATYRIAAFLPAALLGIGVIVVGNLTASGLATCWGLFFLFESITDLGLLVASRSITSQAMVVDHPTALGILVSAS
jgi:hypothetical protein